MKLETMKALVKAADDLGIDGVTGREDYSGRGMYGRRTCGVVVRSACIIAALAAHVAFDKASLGDYDDADGIVKDLLKCGTDSMGRDIIVY